MKRDEGGLTALTLPCDIGGATTWAARLFEVWLIGNINGVGDGLRKNGFCRFDIGGANLQPDSADEVRYLPLKTNQVFVLEETKNACRFEDGAGDDGLGEIAVAADRCQIAVLGEGLNGKGWFDKFKVTIGEFSLQRVTSFIDQIMPIDGEFLEFKIGHGMIDVREFWFR